jgi:hypothetical protein
MKIHRFIFIVAMIVVAAASTLIPHPPNFTPLAAIALFAGAKLNDLRLAFVVTIATLLLRDAIIGFHVLMPIVYACYAFNVWLGSRVGSSQSPARVAAVSIGGSIVFFVITNFAVWITLGAYDYSISGLSACYVAAIPYLRNTFASDLLYSMLMFGAFAIAQTRVPSLRCAAPAK